MLKNHLPLKTLLSMCPMVNKTMEPRVPKGYKTRLKSVFVQRY